MKWLPSCNSRFGIHRFTIEGERWYQRDTGKATYLYCEHCEVQTSSCFMLRILEEPTPKSIWDRVKDRNREFDYE